MSELQSALRRNGLILVGIGVVFALAVIPAFHPAAWLFLQLAYWPMAEVPAALVPPAGVLVAISAGLTVGIGALMWGIGTHVAPVSAEAARRVTTLTGWSWFAVDSTASVLAGAPMNVALNVIFLFLILQAARAGLAAERSTA
ncbi:MAG: hypothetical protein AAFP85_03460 [Pseudomonadota bacterium]